MKLRVLGTLLGRRDDAQYNRAAREESRFREAECDNYPATAPVAAKWVRTVFARRQLPSVPPRPP